MLIDVHCHANLYLDLSWLLKEAMDVGVEKIICVGMSFLGLNRVLEISKQYGSIYASLGIHPEEVQMNNEIESQLEAAKEFIKKNSNRICSIGEIGLDHYFVKDEGLYSLQTKIFKEMLLLAENLRLPVNLHVKGAEKIVFDILPSYKIPNINIHWYSGPEEFLNQGIERGYYFSITPAIKYSPPVKKVATKVENDRLLLESDGPVKYSGDIGTPAMVKEVLYSISKIKNIDPEVLEDQIFKNTKEIFPKIF